MNELFCKVNPFVFQQSIYKINLETQEKELLMKCSFGKLEETLATLAKQEEIYTFHFAGHKKFIQELGKNIETIFKLYYKNIDINVKYN